MLEALEESDSVRARLLSAGHAQDLLRRALSLLDLHSGHTTSCGELRSHLALLWSQCDPWGTQEMHRSCHGIPHAPSCFS